MLGAVLLAVPAASADTPFGLTCGPNGDLQVCNGNVHTFDGVPLGLTITYPANAGPELPLVVVSHGWGGHKADFVGTGVGNLQPWGERRYVALGISGSFQHLGGIKGNPFLLAINKNPKAPIFQAATVGVVADLLELVPVLTEKIKNSR